MSASVLDSRTPSETDTPADEYPDAVRMALVALAAVGVSFFLCHLPYGRIAAVLLCLFAAALAGLSLLGLVRRAWLGWIGTGANALFALLLVGFPGVLGLEGWLPKSAPDAQDASAQSTGVTADGWVDAGEAAWEGDGVRVALTFASVGPQKAGGESKLWIGVRVENVGTRTVNFTSWDASAADGPVLTTAKGGAVRGSRSGAPERKTLAPGQVAECVLAFNVPLRDNALRLELPASAYGGETVARFHIAPELILWK